MSLTEPIIVTRDYPIQRPRGETIVRAAAAKFGVTYADVLGRGKSPQLVQARIQASREMAALGYGLSVIARILRRGDHSAISYYLGRSKGKTPLHTPEWKPSPYMPAGQTEKVLSILTREWMTTKRIIALAEIKTVSPDPRDVVSVICIRLRDRGLVERGGTPLVALWRKR